MAAAFLILSARAAVSNVMLVVTFVNILCCLEPDIKKVTVAYIILAPFLIEDQADLPDVPGHPCNSIKLEFYFSYCKVDG
jgi:hypothetical protein